MASFFNTALSLSLASIIFLSISGCSSKSVPNNDTQSEMESKYSVSERISSVKTKEYTEDELFSGIYVRNKKLNLPCTVQEFKNLGYSLVEEYGEEKSIPPKGQSECDFTDGEGSKLVTYAFNDTDNIVKITKGKIKHISIKNHEDVAKVCGDIGIGSKLKDVYDVYGREPFSSNIDQSYIDTRPAVSYKSSDGNTTVDFFFSPSKKIDENSSIVEIWFYKT